MGKVRTHTRVVNGRRQTVTAHKRQLRPARAKANAQRAYRSVRLRQHGAAAVLGAAAVAEIGGWLALRGVGVALVTIGIAVLGIGVAARRATPSTPQPIRRTPGTVRPAPKRRT